MYNISPGTRSGTDTDMSADGEIEATVRAVKAVFDKDNEVIPIQISGDAYGYLRKVKPDVLFNICEGFGSDNRGEIYVAALLEQTGIPYTGSDFYSLTLCMDKGRTKEILGFHEIPGPAFQVFNKPDDELRQGLSFPLMVKPMREDASLGIGPESVVQDGFSLRKRVAYVLETFAQPALVEEYIEGRELNVSIIGNGENLEVLPISEILFNIPAGRPRIVDYDAKWVKTSPMYGGTEALCPAPLSDRDRKRVADTALNAYRVMGVKDYGRVDIRLKEGKPYVIEVNPNPGKYVDTGFIRSARAAGYGFDEIMKKILDLTLIRCGRQPFSARRETPRKEKQAGFDEERREMETARLYAVSVAKEHIPLLTEWFNDARVARFMEDPEEILSEDEVFEIMLISGLHDRDFVFYEKETETPIGFGAVYDFSLSAGTCEISFLIGEPGAVGKGFGKELARAFIEYCFGQLGANSIFCSVVIENEACVKSLLAEGFVKIGRRRQSHRLGDVFTDEYLFDMTRSDWEEGKK